MNYCVICGSSVRKQSLQGFDLCESNWCSEVQSEDEAMWAFVDTQTWLERITKIRRIEDCVERRDTSDDALKILDRFIKQNPTHPDINELRYLMRYLRFIYETAYMEWRDDYVRYCRQKATEGVYPYNLGGTPGADPRGFDGLPVMDPSRLLTPNSSS